jgi:hypothetical protein
MRNLRIAPVGIGDFLGTSKFAVPLFQRSYSWNELLVQNLLTDLSGAMKRKRDGRGDTYFLGSIVVVERGRDKALEVVDGQQRLATISIILAAIRDYHLETGKDQAAENYDQQFLRALHVPTGRKIPKLKLNEIDDSCYVQAILTEPSKRKDIKWTTNSHKKLIAAYQQAKAYAESISKIHSAKESVAVLYETVEFIRKNVQVINVTVDDDADAFTVFETLNDRHFPLTVADLLKNFLFGSVGEHIDEARGHWRHMLGALSAVTGKKERIVDYVRQLWGSIHGLVREKELFRDIKTKITDESEAREFSAALAHQAADYAAVLNPASERWTKYGFAASEAIATFNALRVERLRPLLLAILNRFDTRQVAKALELLRSVAVRVVVTTGINGTIEEKIFEIAVNVHNGKIKNAVGIAKAMAEQIPNDTVFEAHFATMNVTKAALARFYLQELEEVAKGDKDPDREVKRDERKVTLEHIIPKSASEREKHWPELSSEMGDALYRRLGNLTLLSTGKNSKLNGKPYSEKIVAYRECEGIYITNHIARDYPKWGEDEINERQMTLAKFAVQRWPIQLRKRKHKKRAKL